MNLSPVLVLLAGGKSSRMGSPKGLLDFNETYWLIEQILRFQSVNKPKVFIGLGFDSDLYFNKIPWLKKAISNFYTYKGIEVKVVLNTQPNLGAFSTLQTILETIDRRSSVLVQPIDVPLLNDKELQSLIAIQNVVVIPMANNKNGHPVKLMPQFWNELLNVALHSKEARLDVQIKNIDSSSISYIDVLDTSVYKNLNSKEQWLLYKKASLYK